MKRDRKDSFYSTLVGSEPKLSSDFKISIDIKNSIAVKEFKSNKPELLTFLRSKLKNYNLDVVYKLAESTKIEFSDSKTKFEKLVEENGSLDKLRKLFNLDIEF